ncbi:RNA polymerase sigma-B factor [Arthrobacter pigmenti]|uniref:RNA polymerase sigma-B factor n=1 Tax=Arthrobacter pigmenti TaxID=271432 RepID=A0A846RE91_9MICC|nr:sigma-70 family RNA polymerase sigma factor [Arthrobacter pigmenti]NJC21343.1 RNA polymerase sigma-B factor [Arthrobacter pigmenti]
MRTAEHPSDSPSTHSRAQRSDGRLRAAIHEEMALDHLHVADSIARGFSAFSYDAADIRQVAYMGLVKAAQRFDPTIGVEFCAYAVPTIRGEVKRYLRDCSWIIRPPRELQDLKSEAMKASQTLAQRLGREPSIAELAEELDRSPAVVVEALACAGCQRPESIDASPGTFAWADTLEAEGDDFARSDEVLSLRAAVRELSEKEKELLFRRYFHEESQERIGQRLGMTQMQISRLLARTLVKLQKRLLEQVHPGAGYSSTTHSA